MTTKNCQTCGKEFSFELSKNNIRRYCSFECAPSTLAKGKKLKVAIRQCRRCKNDFKPKEANTKYCSNQCRYASKADLQAAHRKRKDEQESNSPKFAGSSWRFYTDIPDCNIKWRKTRSYRRMDYADLTHCYEVVFEFVNYTRTDEMEHDGKELQEVDLLSYFELVVNNARDPITPAQFAAKIQD
jgi:hypothetical protein